MFSEEEEILKPKAEKAKKWVGSGLCYAKYLTKVANLFYFLGPVTEVVLDKVFRGEVNPTGPGLYRMGLTFSVGLMVLPSLMWTVMMIVSLLSGLL